MPLSKAQRQQILKTFIDEIHATKNPQELTKLTNRLLVEIADMRSDNSETNKDIEETWTVLLAKRAALSSNNKRVAAGKTTNVTFLATSATSMPLDRGISIQHSPNVLSGLKQGYYAMEDLAGDVGDVIGKTADKTGKAAKKVATGFATGVVAGADLLGTGAVKLGKGIGTGVDKTGKAAKQVATGFATGVAAGAGLLGTGAVMLGQGVAAGANMAWSNVVVPFKDSVVGLVEDAVNGIKDSIRNANLQEANEQLILIQLRARSLLDAAIENIAQTIRIENSDLSLEEAKMVASELQEVKSLQVALNNFKSLPKSLGKDDVEKAQELVSAVQTCSYHVFERCGIAMNEARQQIESALPQESDQWLSNLFKSNTNMQKEQFSNLIADLEDNDFNAINKPLFDMLSNLQQFDALTGDKSIQSLIKYLFKAREDKNTPQTMNKIKGLLQKLNEQLTEFDRQQYVDEQLASAMKSFEKVGNAYENMNLATHKMDKIIVAINNPLKGFKRLSSRKIASLSKSINNLIKNIWKNFKNFVTSSPTLIDRLLYCTTKVVDKISQVWDNLTNKFYKFVGIHKLKEDLTCIYSNKGFKASNIKALLDSINIENISCDHNGKDFRKYPFAVEIKLQCVKNTRGGGEPVEVPVPIIEFERHNIIIKSFEKILTELQERDYSIPAAQAIAFELAQRKLVHHIADHNLYGLGNLKTKKGIELIGFDENHFAKIIKDTSLVTNKGAQLKFNRCTEQAEQLLKDSIPRHNSSSGDDFFPVVPPVVNPLTPRH